MARIVMKFGGTSTADTQALMACIAHIGRERAKGNEVAVVVSAPAGMTDHLLTRIGEVTGDAPDHAESDLVLAAGEQVNAGLMALLLQREGIPARSFTGWQAGFITDNAHGAARIDTAHVDDLVNWLPHGVAVLTGFQGMTAQGRVTTLGRGGSDVSAVALAAAVKADRCDIFTDVDGVYTADPRIVPNAAMLDELGAEEALEMASSGAKVLHSRAVELALSESVPLRVLSTFGAGHGTDIVPGLETHLVSGVTYSRDAARLALFGLNADPQTLSELFAALAAEHVTADLVVRGAERVAHAASLVFSTSRSDLVKAVNVLEAHRAQLGDARLEVREKVAKISVIGLGLRSQARLTHTFFAVLSRENIHMDAMATSELRISALIAEDDLERAVRALHFAYELDKPAGAVGA